ncbi:MAG: BrnA antitoxin family protein [Magnetococcales bacterium]|nr:BrnA antitoxin family protein [Magnetococcales bacterium]
MTKPRPPLIMPTPEEDEAIARGIAEDPDTYEPSWEEFMQMRPDNSPWAMKSRKQLLSVRYSPDVISYFRATGKGWQSRMNEALREWIQAHPLGS